MPKWATKPPRPCTIDISSFSVYFPEKQSLISGPGGSDPDRSGENGPHPSRALVVSMT